jgi:hypothetical protein
MNESDIERYVPSNWHSSFMPKLWLSWLSE